MRVALVDNLLLEQRGDGFHFDLQPHLGLISLLAVLEQHGHEGVLIDPKLAVGTGRLPLDTTLYERLADEVLASDGALDEWMLREVSTTNHISGTCKMGPGTDSMAVVDQYGKVRGLDGLRIVDASIMPNLVRAPINPTVVMMGERMAALMRSG